MTYELTVPEKLLTWLDVERVLKQKTQLWAVLPPGIHAVDCYHDGVDIEHSCDVGAVEQWLRSIFGRAFSAQPCELHLRAGDGKYPVRLEKVEHGQKTRQLPLYPLWREVAYLEGGNNTAPATFNLPAPFSGGPKLISFHSFKGGVGRTTALMTYVTARLHPTDAQGPVKVLVVDADLEAPGVTFWLDEKNRPQVSFVQFLEAMHYPPVSEEASLDFFAEQLKKTSMDVDGSQRELFVLPAALDLAEIQDMPVQPGHLARNPDNPWILTNHLHALGKRLGADAVFIDLRAGLSELASPVIFDPRVEHYFVTTVAKQSVSGMCEVLRRLHAFHRALPDQQRQAVKPSVVISLLTTDLRRLPDFGLTKECIEQAYPPVNDSLDEGVEWLEADFSPSLMSIGTVRDAFDLLKTSSLYASSAQAWATTIAAANQVAGNRAASTINRNDAAQALLEVCKREYAEHSATDDWLVTEPLRNLGKHFTNDIPNAVLVGAKGAGKTFTYLQICQSRNWASYLQRVGEIAHDAAVAQQRIIFPVLWSGNVDGAAKTTVGGAKDAGIQQLGLGTQALTLSEIQRQIEENLDSEARHWDDFWADLIAASLGCSGRGLQAINQQLSTQGQSVVLVFDGVEDVFKKPSDAKQTKAIESLLKLVNRLSELPNQTLGALVFVRIDYVQAAIKQNLGQFMSRFSAFALTWNPESFLRLAYWLCAKAGIVGATVEGAQTLSVGELIEKLTELWGHKLGQTDSKEGHSARWVYAALCDLTGRFQARDLVRFFRFAAEEETKNSNAFWTERILSPESMRKAIPRCSHEKVQEATLEIQPLRSWSERMDAENITERSIPFSASSVSLQSDELTALRELGVVYEDLDPSLGDKRLFLPEIYRAGLRFDLSGGRPRIQALLKKNLGKMPF
jgi:MinD-like ATPase involved in chromosome partitioning or flagellar assembly